MRFVVTFWFHKKYPELLDMTAIIVYYPEKGSAMAFVDFFFGSTSMIWFSEVVWIGFMGLAGFIGLVRLVGLVSLGGMVERLGSRSVALVGLVGFRGRLGSNSAG